MHDGRVGAGRGQVKASGLGADCCVDGWELSHSHQVVQHVLEDSAALLQSIMKVAVDGLLLAVCPATEVDDHAAAGPLKVRWLVGGASTVSSTFLSLHAPPAQAKQVMAGLNKGVWTHLLRALVQPAATFEAVDGDGQQEARAVAPGAEVYRVPSGGGSGAGRWKAKNFMSPDSFDASIGHEGAGGVSGLPDGTYWAVAWARVDERWGAEHQGSPQWQTPQTHASLLRTDPNYRIELNSHLRGPAVKRVVQGRLYWPSDPVVLAVKGGRVTVVSSVLQCAWWHRQRH